MSQVDDYFAALRERIDKSVAELNALDAATGDGDHGTTMLRGLTRADGAEAGAKARAFMRASGGAAGTLFGLVLLAIERHLFQDDDLAGQLALAEERICDLGDVAPGDKSLVDALHPAVAALRAGGTTSEAAAAAGTGRDATRDLEARRGRAQYVEDKGRGHLDPGAVSIVMLLETLADIKERPE